MSEVTAQRVASIFNDHECPLCASLTSTTEVAFITALVYGSSITNLRHDKADVPPFPFMCSDCKRRLALIISSVSTLLVPGIFAKNENAS